MDALKIVYKKSCTLCHKHVNTDDVGKLREMNRLDYLVPLGPYENSICRLKSPRKENKRKINFFIQKRLCYKLQKSKQFDELGKKYDGKITHPKIAKK